MRYSYAIFSSFLFASAVLATPQPGFIKRDAGAGVAGAILEKDRNTFQGNRATFKVPRIQGESGTVSGVWVSIDGFTCTSTILAAGVEMTINNNKVSYAAKYRFFPGDLTEFPISVGAGDELTFHVTTSGSGTSATVSVENNSNGQRASKQLTSTTALCGKDVAWFVDAKPDTVQFGEVKFQGATASGPHGSHLPGDGPTTLNMVENGRALTSVAVSGSTVDIKNV